MSAFSKADVTFLRERQRELLEAYKIATDESKWPTMETKTGRGDRYWFARNATVLAGALHSNAKLLSIAIAATSGKADPTEETEHDPALAALIDRGERDAEAMIAKLREKDRARADGQGNADES